MNKHEFKSYPILATYVWVILFLFVGSAMGSVASIKKAHADIKSPVADTTVKPVYDETRQKQFIYFAQKLAGRKAQLLIAIAGCEGLYSKTQLNTSNKDHTIDHGPLQINSVHFNRVPG